jgi:hypothetical protein
MELTMELAASTLKHGVPPEDTLHAWRNAQFTEEVEYAGETRLFVIGPARDGTLLELIAVKASQRNRIIHSDRLRPQFYSRLISWW